MFSLVYSYFILKKVFKFPIVWHPRCGPCPSNELAGMLDGSTVLTGNQINGNIIEAECDRLSNSLISEMQVCDFTIFRNTKFTRF